MNGLRVSLFGKLEVRFRDRVLPGFHIHKVQELFAYLLLKREHPLRRETLGGLLWGDGPAAPSKKYLRQALWQLHTVLESECKPINAPLLLVEPDWIYLNPDIDLWLDVTVFERAFARVEGIPGEKLDAERVEALQEAEQLYQGDLIEGCYQDWCLYERERLQNMHLAMLGKLMGYCELHRAYETGLTYGARILSCDRANERAHRRLMRLHCLAGDRTAALRQYERCAAVLGEELGARPSRRTMALYEQIRADQFHSPPPLPAEASTTTEATTAMLPGVLDHLKQIQAVLAGLQRQVEQEVQVVERAMNGRH